jgi:alkylhydroperoxidase family enzyme
MPDSPAPRIAPLAVEELTEQQRELLGGAGGLAGTASNIFATLVRHPGLFRRWLPFGGKLLVGKLSPRDRELLILRTAWNCKAPYEWGQHVSIAKSSGLTDEEIGRVPRGADAAGWDHADQTLLRVADELHDTATISDHSWAALRARFDDAQLVELPMLVGHYHLVAFTLNALGVPLEDGLPAMPSA